MRLCIDIGNTRTKVHLFEGSTLIDEAKWTSPSLEDLLLWLKRRTISASLLSASGIVHSDIEQWLQAHTRYFKLNHLLPLPITIDYETPATLGADRIAGAVGAYQMSKGKTCLKIDAGTCTTYDLITSNGVFSGGAISPGMTMRATALHHYSARLPLVQITDPTPLVGKSTEAALRSGVLQGWRAEVLGMIQLFETEYQIEKVIVTGGDANFLEPLPLNCQIAPQLVAHGMDIILQYAILHTPIS